MKVLEAILQLITSPTRVCDDYLFIRHNHCSALLITRNFGKIRLICFFARVLLLLVGMGPVPCSAHPQPRMIYGQSFSSGRFHSNCKSIGIYWPSKFPPT